jgi:hypothetical protein
MIPDHIKKIVAAGKNAIRRTSGIKRMPLILFIKNILNM